MCIIIFYLTMLCCVIGDSEILYTCFFQVHLYLWIYYHLFQNLAYIFVYIRTLRFLFVAVIRMCMWWCIHIFFLSFLPRYSNWVCASTLPWNESAAWLSLFIAVVIIKMTLIMMIVIEWGWRCHAFVCVATDFPSSVQCFVFILWRNVMMVMQMWVSSQRLCKLFVFASLVFLRFFFGSRVTSFCSAFGCCFDSWSVCFCFCFALRNSSLCWLLLLFWSAAVSLRCCYWAVFERKTLSFSSQDTCFDLERAVPAFVFNVGGCFDTRNALLFHQ